MTTREVGGPLVIEWTPGTVPTLRAPIPRFSILTLATLTAVAWREWVVVVDEHAVEAFAHTFDVVGWQRLPGHGLVVMHRCCGAEL